MSNSALKYQNTPPLLEQRHFVPSSSSTQIQTESNSEIEVTRLKQHAVLLKNKLIQLNKEHEELYRQFATAHTDFEVTKTRLSIYEKALKQILSAADFEKVKLIAETKATQQREHTLAMHKWSDLV